MSKRRVHWVKSRIRRDSHSCEANRETNICVSSDMHPPRRSSRRTGSVLGVLKLSIDIRRDKRVFVFADISGRKDPVMETQCVKSSSSKYFAFCTRTAMGSSVINAQLTNFT
jgi:hypothetical protein